MNDTCATVMIETDNGPVRINESDYDPKVHKLMADQTTASIQADLTAHAAGEAPGAVTEVVTDPGSSAPAVVVDAVVEGAGDPGAPVTEQPAPAPVAAPAVPVVLLVSKTGKKFFVVDVAGKVVTGDGIDAAGYASQEDAMAVIVGLTDEQKATVKAAE